MEERNTEKLNSRREILKKVGKTAAFVVPTMITFKVSALAVPASGSSTTRLRQEPEKPTWCGE